MKRNLFQRALLWPSCAAALFLVPSALAQAPPELPDTDQPQTISWQGADASGAALAVPNPDKPTVMVFIMANQATSAEALQQLQTALGDDAEATQVFAVVSGREARAKMEQVRADTRWPWPMVADPDYTTCDQFAVRAWPTTVLVDTGGQQVGHIGGLPRTYQKDLVTYLDFLHGRTGAEQLDEQLHTGPLIVNGKNQAVMGHLQTARQLAARGRAEEAHAELMTALAIQPDDPRILLALARSHLVLDQPDRAIEMLDRIEPGTVAAFQLNVIRGRALLAREQWDDARAILSESVRLNPSPAETHYLLGLIEQHDGRWQAAAEHFRAAFEATHDGQLIGAAPAEGGSN